MLCNVWKFTELQRSEVQLSLTKSLSLGRCCKGERRCRGVALRLLCNVRKFSKLAYKGTSLIRKRPPSQMLSHVLPHSSAAAGGCGRQLLY